MEEMEKEEMKKTGFMIDKKNIKKVLEKSKAAIPYLLAAIICLCISIPVFSQSVVLDEAYSITLVRKSVPGIIRGAAIDVHPPLYYLILKFSGLFGGESFVKYRIVTYLPVYLNLLVLGATFVRKRWGNRTAIFYLLWLGSVYCTFELSSLIRMYSWAVFFVTAAALHMFFYYECGKIRDYLLGILMTLAAMYTHYYAVLSVFLVWTMILAAAIVYKKERIKRVFIGGFCIALGYLPWAWVLFLQTTRVSRNYWISAIGWKRWFDSPAQMMECTLAGTGTVLYFLIFVLLLLAVWQKQKDALLFFGVFAGTMLLGMLLSILIAPIWQNRYLYVAWGTLSLFAAIITGKKVSKFTFIPQFIIGGVLCFTLVLSVQTVLQDGLMSSSDREWVDFIEREIEADALVIIDDPGEHICVFQCYLPEAEIVMTESLTAEKNREALRTALEAADEKQIWYIIDHTQAQLGYEQVSEMLDDMNCKTDTKPTANYTVKYKNLGIYKVEKNEK